MTVVQDLHLIPNYLPVFKNLSKTFAPHNTIFNLRYTIISDYSPSVKSAYNIYRTNA